MDDGAAQAAQGCAVCGDPSDPMKEERESAKRTVCRGKRPLVLLVNKSGSFQSHSPRPEGRRETPSRARPSHSMGQSHIQSAAVQCTAPTAPRGDAFPATGL